MPKITFTHILIGAAIAGGVWYMAKPKQPEPEQETEAGFDWFDWNEYLETEYTIDTITDMLSEGWEDLKDLID